MFTLKVFVYSAILNAEISYEDDTVNSVDIRVVKMEEC